MKFLDSTTCVLKILFMIFFLSLGAKPTSSCSGDYQTSHSKVYGNYTFFLVAWGKNQTSRARPSPNLVLGYAVAAPRTRFGRGGPLLGLPAANGTAASRPSRLTSSTFSSLCRSVPCGQGSVCHDRPNAELALNVS